MFLSICDVHSYFVKFTALNNYIRIFMIIKCLGYGNTDFDLLLNYKITLLYFLKGQ